MELVIFDLDGVLMDSKDAHYECLNKALEIIDKKYIITPEEHHDIYDAKPTLTKLKMLSERKGLESFHYDEIFRLKQLFTMQYIHTNIEKDDELVDIFSFLKNMNCKTACASNSIYNTVKLSLLKLGLMEHIDYFITNEDVKNPKPHPEMFLKCMSRFGTSPNNTIIVEDSHVGIAAARKSGAHVIPVKSRSSVKKNLFYPCFKEVLVNIK